MHKFAIVIHSDLKVKKFEHNDDFRIAINSLLSKDKDFTVFKYHAQLDTWVKPETHEW